MARHFKILALNHISQVGLRRLPGELYSVAKDVPDADAVVVRSADMHTMEVPRSVRAIGRAGAGTNNIPVAAMSRRGVPVFNTPGANANAVKELVLAGMLIAARNLVPALNYVGGLKGDDGTLHKLVEDGKKQFAGIELPGHTLGVIGLGKIGSLVANAAVSLGMNVLGFDPELTVEAAWSLSSQVKKAHSIDEVLKLSHFVTLHVPLVDSTRKLINGQNIEVMRGGAILLNFSREGIADEEAVAAALASQRLKCYVSDFPTSRLIGVAGAVALPHLGASTREAEDNCAVMVVEQLRDYLEHGNISNSVNFPTALLPREGSFRLAITHANIPKMVAQISTHLGGCGLNIRNMLNKSKGELAYTLVDLDSDPRAGLMDELGRIDGVLGVRGLPAA
jgi:D-3-phosphoglycerate dehydrogenase